MAGASVTNTRLSAASSRGLNRARRAAVVLGLFACVLLTHQRARVWHDSLSLWDDAIRRTPDAPRPAINMAKALDSLGYSEPAVWWLGHARVIAARPSTFSAERQRQWYAIALTNEAHSLIEHQNPHQARTFASLAVQLSPRRIDSWQVYYAASMLMGYCTSTPPTFVGGPITWRCPNPPLLRP